MTDKNLTPAQAAQQNNRDGAGKYATAESPEATGVELDTKRVAGPEWDGTIFEGAEIIHVYTRADAIADGVLVDKLKSEKPLSDLAQEAGVAWPVTMTRAAYTDTVAWNDDEKAYQDEEGRAWDVMWMSSLAIKRFAASPEGSGGVRAGTRVPFTFLCVPPGKKSAQLTTLHAVVSSQDDGSPCFTYMLPEED